MITKFTSVKVTSIFVIRYFISFEDTVLHT